MKIKYKHKDNYIKKAIELSKNLYKIQDIKDFSEYNFIGLSNVFDWLDTESTQYIIETLKATTKKHCKILLRQLNNSLHYDFGEDFNESILDQDNSMFYNRITLYEKK